MSTILSRQKKLKEIIDDDKIFKGSDLDDLTEGRKYLYFGNDAINKVDVDTLLFVSDFIKYTENVYFEEEKNNQFDINSYDYILFQNFNFSKQIIINDLLGIDLRFDKCDFKVSPFKYGLLYDFKMKFRSCCFDVLKVNNVDFKDYLEFFDCSFINHTIFKKCNFYKNVTFTKSFFLSNAFFTYSSFYKQLIFNRAKFGEKSKPTGLDLSQSIINGTISFFMVRLYSFPSEPVDLHSFAYDDLLKIGKHIPIQNSRETLRIIKHQLLNQNNLIEAEKYAKLEKLTYMKEIYKNFKFDKLPSLITLFFNLISNYFKTSWTVGFAFIFGFAAIFDIWLENISPIYFIADNTLIKLINPTDFSFYDEFKNNEYAYSVYFAGKIMIGFGIYQLIQAFRKFK